MGPQSKCKVKGSCASSTLSLDSDYTLTGISGNTYFPCALAKTLNCNNAFQNQPDRAAMAAVARKRLPIPSKPNHPFVCFLALDILSYCSLMLFVHFDSLTL